MDKVLIAFLFLGLLFAATACSSVETSNVKAIADIKTAENLGKNFTVQGTVENNVKIGSISGYRLKDATDSIPVSSQKLPQVNTTVTVTGTLQTSTFFGYYLLAIEK